MRIPLAIVAQAQIRGRGGGGGGRGGQENMERGGGTLNPKPLGGLKSTRWVANAGSGVEHSRLKGV